MYIKSIVLDGFKSYGKRTEIVGFDQLFNAITGLNGSGKSNILDAICFVLGLSNMSLARCTTLRELIFKNGQAGVHKAIVTITFDNTDKDQSPTGYEHVNEIVIRREVHLNSRTKYYVCGQSVSNNQVSDLFHSVQLNISNPHFLIMQGRITKVLNMKPHDILAMIEEATGVSMYEVKKKSTQGMIEKKDQALKSIDSLISETILPKLDQLRKEHAFLLDFQNLVGEYEKSNKQLVAYQFTQNQKKADHASVRTEDCKQKMDELEKSTQELKCKQEEISGKISDIERHNDEHSGGKIAELERELKEGEREEIKESGKLEILVDGLSEEKKNKENEEKQLTKEQGLKEVKQFKYENSDFEKIEEEFKRAESNFEKAQKNYDAIAAGKALNEEGEATESIADQLIKAEEEYNSSKTENKILKAKLINCKRELIEKRAEANKHKSQYDEDNKHLEGLENNVYALKGKMDSIRIDYDKYLALEEERDHQRNRLREINHKLSNEKAYSQLKFEYTPIPNFDPSCVRGMACMLFTLKDIKYARAIEKAAGRKNLHVVIIDTNDQVQKILDKGNLKTRYDFVALNKIDRLCRPVDRRSIETAKRIANDKDIALALDLIEYEPHFKIVMEYVFGDTIVVPDQHTGQKVTKSTNKKTVSLDGDVVFPGGDMHGGSFKNDEFILGTLIELKPFILEKPNLEKRLDRIEKSLAEMETVRKSYLSSESEYKIHSSKLDMTRQRLQLTSSYHKMFEAVKQLENEIEHLNQSIKRLDDIDDKLSKKTKDLKTRLSNKEQSHKKELESAEKTLNAAKKEMDSKKKLYDRKKVEVDTLKLEIEDLTKSCEQQRINIERLNSIIEKKQEELDEQTKVVGAIKSVNRDIANRLKEQKNKLREQNNEINKLSKMRDKIGAEINDKKLEIKKITHEVEQINSEAKEASHIVRSMLRKYDWIHEERHLFGKENSDYPFNRKDFSIQDLSARVQKLQATKNTMQKTVNQRANLLLSDKEKEAEQLRNKRTVIEQDKEKLIKYMEEVDRKKKDALYKAWRKINVDFDSIFSTFLPSTHAKLDLVAGKDLLDGLEVKVAFGDVWKESLTELSGGQRSLVALSLILALLKYNPAPLYILDEVDAALDQNHTQNTGTMIKKHFNKSQFIIVSLKDDMFRNANVLFKTKFVDGKSTVTRYTHSSK